MGHTHEDCDAIFGVLWKLSRAQHILTPDQYKQLMYDALSKASTPVHVEDILVTPNYVDLLDSCIDPELEYFTKNEDTQLQWRFKSVEVCSDYPFGVKTEYRLYAQDTPTIIVEQIDKYDLYGIGYEALDIECVWHGSWNRSEIAEEIEILNDSLSINTQSAVSNIDDKEKRLNQLNQILNEIDSGLRSNIHILVDLPFEAIKPSGFVTGASNAMQKTLRKFNKIYRGDKYSQHRRNFETFINSMPLNDNVTDFISQNSDKFHVPLLATRLFNSSSIDTTSFIPPIEVIPRTFNGKPIRKVKSAPSVKHSGNRHLILPSSVINLDGTPVLTTITTGQESLSLDITTIMTFNETFCPVGERKLKEILQSLQLRTTGTKNELLIRLQSFYYPGPRTSEQPKRGKKRNKAESDDAGSENVSVINCNPLNEKTVKDLKKHIKDNNLNIKGYSSMRRDELIQK